MEDKLKQRLVGAIVLSTLAVIFVPFLLEEDVEETSISRQPIPKIPDEFSTGLITIPGKFQMTEKIRRIKAKSKQDSSAEVKQLKMWFVQVGSFTENENALLLRDKLRQGGYVAFVEAVDDAKEKLYRVRVGPEIRRNEAEETQRRLETTFELKGLVVSHP